MSNKVTLKRSMAYLDVFCKVSSISQVHDMYQLIQKAGQVLEDSNNAQGVAPLLNIAQEIFWDFNIFDKVNAEENPFYVIGAMHEVEEFINAI